MAAILDTYRVTQNVLDLGWVVLVFYPGEKTQHIVWTKHPYPSWLKKLGFKVKLFEVLISFC